jgi:hypothetical protein
VARGSCQACGVLWLAILSNVSIRRSQQKALISLRFVVPFW